MKRIAFVCPYFGKFPRHFQLWLNSCAHNKDHTWFIFTDDKRTFDYPTNVVVRYTTLGELKEVFQQKFDFPISLEGAYKLGDYKPLFGFLFEELLSGYDAWGHIDVYDEIYGDINTFVTDELLERYDKLMIFGHMTIYKNTADVNRRFMLSSAIDLDYRTIFSSDAFYNFEEIAPGSIYQIYRHNSYEIGRLDERIADISGLSFEFRLGTWPEECSKCIYVDGPMIFSWEDGRVYQYSLENQQVVKKEYLYVHFKRRSMAMDVAENASSYCIVPTGFIPMEEAPTREFILKHSKKKLFYSVYFNEKKKGIQRRIRKFFKR
ncbi:hypothetical protein NHG29_03740 [Aerococcaceae bacterium NML160702]|nr:hypothetical protein [Aerococcaceae bacterium NML160702]